MKVVRPEPLEGGVTRDLKWIFGYERGLGCEVRVMDLSDEAGSVSLAITAF